MRIYSKQLMVALVAVAAIGIVTPAHAGYTNGYTRQNGTYVQPHYSSNPNGSVTDNYSYQGNSNPYTGQTGSNYYRSNPNSPNYNGYGNAYGR